MTYEVYTIIRLYPNQATSIVYLPSDHSIQTVYAVSMDGRKIRLEVEAKRVDISGLEYGLYVIILLYENGIKKRVKIMISKRLSLL